MSAGGKAVMVDDTVPEKLRCLLVRRIARVHIPHQHPIELGDLRVSVRVSDHVFVFRERINDCFLVEFVGK